MASVVNCQKTFSNTAIAVLLKILSLVFVVLSRMYPQLSTYFLRCHGVMGVPGCHLVERLEIYSPPGVSVGLPRDDHPVAPCDKSSDRDAFDNPQPDVPFQASFHLVLEVDGDVTGVVDCDLSGILVNQ